MLLIAANITRQISQSLTTNSTLFLLLLLFPFVHYELVRISVLRRFPYVLLSWLKMMAEKMFGVLHYKDIYGCAFFVIPLPFRPVPKYLKAPNLIKTTQKTQTPRLLQVCNFIIAEILYLLCTAFGELKLKNWCLVRIVCVPYFFISTLSIAEFGLLVFL